MALVIINASTKQENITFVNIYAANIEKLRYLKQILTNRKEEINSNTIKVGDFNAPFTSMFMQTVKQQGNIGLK